MKIGFISEYFPPFAPGGAEWSTYYLASDLSKKEEVIIITPKYKNQKFEETPFKVFRYPFYKTYQGHFNILTSFAHTNPLWIIWSGYHVYKIAKKEKVDVLHIHGKFSIIPTKLANLLLRKPILITARDYQIICNYGFCLYNKDKACNLLEYFSKDFIYYINNYLPNKSLLTIFLNLIFAIWGRIIRNLIKSVSSNMNIVVLSNKQKDIIIKNGFRNVFTVGNSTEFKFREPLKKKENSLVFAGRLTQGKGVNLIIKTIPDLFNQFPNFKFYFAGDGPLKEKLMNLQKKYKQIVILGSIKHEDLLTLYRVSKGVVMPSIWQEPFGRVAMEGLSAFTPAVVTNKGGLPEIIKDKRWGYVVPANPQGLLSGLVELINNNEKLISNIKKDFDEIKKKFGTNITEEYITLYQKIK